MNRRIDLVCPGMTSISFPFFAVSTFILQKFQQGIPLPKRIPHPLKALLPAAPARSVWELSEKKIDELESIWSSLSAGKSTIPAKTGREAIQKVCKKAAVARQMCVPKGKSNVEPSW